MNKALELLHKYKANNIAIAEDFGYPPDEVFMVELDEAIAELEALESRSCEGCKWNYVIENRDMDTNERLDDLMPDACYMCCNAHQLQWEAKQ